MIPLNTVSAVYDYVHCRVTTFFHQVRNKFMTFHGLWYWPFGILRLLIIITSVDSDRQLLIQFADYK